MFCLALCPLGPIPAPSSLWSLGAWISFTGSEVRWEMGPLLMGAKHLYPLHTVWVALGFHGIPWGRESVLPGSSAQLGTGFFWDWLALSVPEQGLHSLCLAAERWEDATDRDQLWGLYIGEQIIHCLIDWFTHSNTDSASILFQILWPSSSQGLKINRC